MTPVVTGPATQPYWVDFTAGDTWIGVRLRPENAASLWQGQIDQAQDAVLRGAPATALVRSLATGSADLTRVVTTISTTGGSERLVQVLDAIHASGGRMQITRLAQFAGGSARHLGRVFRHHIGLSVKTYAQLVQFHRTLKLIRVGRVSLTSAAYEGGYADQSHLTRSFQRFGGFAPSDMPEELSMPTLFPG